MRPADTEKSDARLVLDLVHGIARAEQYLPPELAADLHRAAVRVSLRLEPEMLHMLARLANDTIAEDHALAETSVSPPATNGEVAHTRASKPSRPAPFTQPRPLTLLEAADYLGISRTHAYQLARKGMFPGAFRMGGKRIYVHADAVDRYLEERSGLSALPETGDGTPTD